MAAVAQIPLLKSPLDANKVDAEAMAKKWASLFDLALSSENPDAALPDIFISSTVPWWKDSLALTWDLRTFDGLPRILKFLSSARSTFCISALTFHDATLVSMADNLAFIRATYTFETDIAKCYLVTKLVPAEGEWKAWVVFSKMEDLKGHEEDLKRLDSPDGELGDHVDALVVGAGQSGLQVAAAMRTLGIKCLIVEQRDHVGDHWRGYYDILKLHLSKWYCQFAYRPFPPETPYYPSRDDVANFLECYTKELHLSVMTSTTVQSARFDHEAGDWVVSLVSGDGATKSLRAGQLVMASGLFGLKPIIPMLKEQNEFRGSILHSIQFKNGSIGKGKKAVIVGVGNSGHDIAQDLYDHGASVTMIQRNPTMVTHQVVTAAIMKGYYETGVPVVTADLIYASNPSGVNRLLAKLPPKAINPSVLALNQRLVTAGFQLKPPDRLVIVYERAGGHYLNTGTSELIAAGKIGIKSGVPIESYTTTGLKFADGSTLEADLVVFATGLDLDDMRKTALHLIGPEESKDLKEVWGLDEEGQVKGAYRYSGHPKLWYHTGDFQAARLYAKVTALQVKATQLGILKRYKR